MRGWWAAIVVVTGCARSAHPAVTPEGCRCPQKCKTEIVAAPTPSSPPAEVESEEARITRAVYWAGIPNEAPALVRDACDKHLAALSPAVDKTEPALFLELKEAHDLLHSEADDPTTREILAWSSYDAALQAQHAKVAAVAAKTFGDYVFTHPVLAPSIEHAIDKAHSLDVPETWSPAFLKRLYAIVLRSLEPVITPASVECATRAIAPRRPRYLALFRS